MAQIYTDFSNQPTNHMKTKRVLTDEQRARGQKRRDKWAEANPEKAKGLKEFTEITRVAVWRLQNPEKHRESWQSSRLRHIDKIRIYDRDRKRLRADDGRERANAWYKANSERWKARSAAWRKANPERELKIQRDRALKQQLGPELFMAVQLEKLKSIV